MFVRQDKQTISIRDKYALQDKSGFMKTLGNIYNYGLKAKSGNKEMFDIIEEKLVQYFNKYF